jgi:glyoxylase-like metal-dependent hydrolase (beta-lactamase superfamily II)
MNDIEFNRNFSGNPGESTEISPLIRRVLCNNPGPFTFTGTLTFIVGRGEVAIIDPGPDDEAHLRALRDAVGGETVSHILITHTHADHSPLTRRLKALRAHP